MTPQTLKNVLQVMSDMADLELALAALYQACSDAFPEDGDFWLAIKRQEEEHADSVRQMAALVSETPQDFEIGRAFNSIAIRTIKARIADCTAQIRNRQIPRDKALVIARDIENSVLEANYGEFVKTGNLRFKAFVDILANDTSAHKNLLVQKAPKGKG